VANKGRAQVPGADDLRYKDEIEGGLDRIRIRIFLCGSGLGRLTRGARAKDIRSFLSKKLRSEMKGCDVRVGEHKGPIRAFKDAVGQAAANLADHELSFASRESTDLVIIFPCSPGSFAELGMFAITRRVAQKMNIFVSRLRRRSRGFVTRGPVRAALSRNAKVHFVDYRSRLDIWKRVRQLVLAAKSIRRSSLLLQP